MVNTSVLNVRSGAGTDYDRVGKLSGGTVVTVLAEAGDGWYQVSTDSLTGYVSGEYLTVVDAKTLEELSTKGLQLVELAMEYLGVPYRYGGASPSGFDCSGFVYYLCKSLGVSVPRTATSQWNGGYDKATWCSSPITRAALPSVMWASTLAITSLSTPPVPPPAVSSSVVWLKAIMMLVM